MSTVEDMLKEILQNQKKLAIDVKQQKELVQNIEKRLAKIETRSPTIKSSNVPTSLIRVLKGMIKEDTPMSAEEASKKVNLSRNLTSGYLNRLSDLGYVSKERNLEDKNSRYLFKVNYSAIPENIRKILKEYER